MTRTRRISSNFSAGAADHPGMMTLYKAKRLALDGLARLTGRSASDLLLIDGLTMCRRSGWIFFYESRAYLETGDVAQAIGRTGPVVVTHGGAVYPLDGERPVEEVLRDLEKSLRQRVAQP